MSRFAINKDFESAKADVGDTGIVMEILRLDDENYAIFEYVNGHPQEVGCYTRLELKTIWQLLTLGK